MATLEMVKARIRAYYRDCMSRPMMLDEDTGRIAQSELDRIAAGVRSLIPHCTPLVCVELPGHRLEIREVGARSPTHESEV